MRVLVTTPTGHVGSRVVQRLTDAGVATRVFVRDPSRIPVGLRSRVEVWRGDLEDAAELGDAMRGVDAALLVIPSFFAQTNCMAWQRGIARSIATAMHMQDRPPRAVFLSGIGAHRDDLGAVSGLGHAERVLAAATPDLVILRAGSFMENVLGALPGIVQQGALFDVPAAERRVPTVATRDVGDVAVRWLLDDRWHGQHVVGVHGPADISYADRARTLTEVLGQRVTYVQVPDTTLRQAMAGMGMSASVVDAYTAIAIGIARYEPLAAEPRTPETTTPTTFADWAREALLPMVAATRRGTTARA